MAGTCIFSIIISKLGYQQELYPVILFEVDKKLEVGFYHIVLMFALTICLKMESYGKSLFNFEEVTKQ